MNQSIELIVSPSGESKVETRGYSGGTCRLASLFLEQALGAKIAEQLTSEFYEQPLQHENVAREQSRS